jgi:glycosyltransferase involved in cell wall biosynthesis
MKVLFIHRNFPGQFKNIARSLAADPANDVRFISQPNGNEIPGVRRVTYALPRPASPETHHYVREHEQAVIAGQAVARQIMRLAADGFRPDIVIGHNGWGETLFVKDVLPATPLLSYFEFYYHWQDADTNFDPEFPLGLDDRLRIRMKNAVNLIGLEAADWGLSATRWQRSLYPAWAQRRISVLHEGVDTGQIAPDPHASFQLPNGRRLTGADSVVTYVSRNLEPYRGFHTFARSLPRLLDGNREAVVVVVGGNGVSYGSRPKHDASYLAQLMREIRINWERVWFLGQVEYLDYLRLLQISTAHVYLTYPFVLSWSALEAMAAGCLIIGSDTPPVAELIRHGQNGCLVDFFDSDALAKRILWALARPGGADRLRAKARATIAAGYDFETKIRPKFEALLDRLTDRRSAGTATRRTGLRKPSPADERRRIAEEHRP